MPTAPSNHRVQQTERRRQQLEALADAVDILPGSFVVPMRVLELHRRGTADMGEYAKALCADSSLTARILSLVNSAAFSPAKPVTRLTQAITMIGLRNLMPLIFGTSLAGIFNRLALPSADRRVLWRSSLLKGIAAREYCLFVGSESAEEAFLCGLMQDAALPLIFISDRAMWSEVAAALDTASVEDRQERELRLQGIEHGELGERLAKHLGLPALFQQAIRLHHGSASELTRHLGDASLGSAVQLAGELPHRLTQPNQAMIKRLVWRLRMLPGKGGQAIEPAEAEVLVGRIGGQFEEMLKMLGDADENSMAFREFMQHLSREVTQCLYSAIGGTTVEISNLKTRESQLIDEMQDLRQQAAQSEFDALTGILNRRGFDNRIGRWLKTIQGHNLPCVLGYLDVDDFKQINDKLGHAAGDEALTMMARLLVRAVAGRGIVARIGGDELSLVFVPHGPEDVAPFAGRLKTELAGARLKVEGKTIPIRASVGLLCLEPGRLNVPIEQAIRKADELMYAMKKSGKGRCALARLDEAGAVQMVDLPETPSPAAQAHAQAA